MTPPAVDELESRDSFLLRQPALAPGFLACLFLFFLYELGLLLAGDDGCRNLAEYTLSRTLVIFGPAARYLRWAALLVAGGFAYRSLRRAELGLRSSLVRIVGEGLLAGILLGPFLMVLLSVFDAWPGRLGIDPMPEAPPLASTLRLFGAAAWEELFFRVGCYSILFLVLGRVTRFFGFGRTISLAVADIAGLVGSSVLFAAFHLEFFQRWIGQEGAAHSTTAFLWRLVAGLLLAGLYRWRGLGVAAWAHGLFNLGLTLGAGPGVFR
jgi:hypothetical protein